MRRSTLSRAVATAVVSVISLCYLLPLAWMIGTSLKPQEDVSTTGLSLLPEHPARIGQYAYENYYAGRPTFVDDAGIERAGYEGVLTSENVHFVVFLRNTVIILVLSVVGMTLSSAVCAYGFSKIRWRGRNVLFLVAVATMMIPFPAVMIPTYFIFKHLGWIGTFRPLWVPAWFGNAFNIFLLRQFFLQIPDDLCEAARLDGMSHWAIFWRIIVPLSKPALLLVALFHSIFVWNDFIGPLIYLNHQDQFTLALGLQCYQAQHGGTPWNLLMAACTLVTGPILLLFILTQRTLIDGIATTGLKG